MNIPENDLTRVSDTDYNSDIHLNMPVMNRTAVIEKQSEKSRIARTSSISTDVAKDEMTSPTKNLTLEERVEAAEIRTDEQQEQLNKLQRQVNINKQNSEKNTHEINKRLQAKKQREKRLNQFAKDQANIEERIDNVRQGYGKGMKALDQLNEQIEKNAQILKEMDEREENIQRMRKQREKDCEEMDADIKDCFRMISEYQAEQNANKNELETSKSEDDRELSDINMNDVDGQLNAFNRRRFQ